MGCKDWNLCPDFVWAYECNQLYHLFSQCIFVSNLKGEYLASCDADGVVKFWDVRNVSEAASVSTGSKPANKVVFDPSSKSLAVITNEGILHFLSSKDASFLRSVPVVDSSLHSIAFDKNNDFLVAGSGGIIILYIIN